MINIFQANKVNCQIITVPHDILKKTSLIEKNLDDLSLETVQMFLNDATRAGYKIKINKWISSLYLLRVVRDMLVAV